MEVSGQRFRLQRPLDWSAVTDHAEYLGEMETILQADAPAISTPPLGAAGVAHDGGTGEVVPRLRPAQSQRQARTPALPAGPGLHCRSLEFADLVHSPALSAGALLRGAIRSSGRSGRGGGDALCFAPSTWAG